MVVFTCNYCGDSVKKPKVEKHINIECKRKRYGNASLCCIDCLKDFNFQSYQAHTKCVTEEERYSAPGFVPRPSSCKGERKQSSWLDVVQTVLLQPNLSMPEKDLLQAISKYDNIPRKKVKFLNFLRNSGNFARIHPKVVDRVYDLLDSEFKATSAQVTTNKAENIAKEVPSEVEKESNKADISVDIQVGSIDSEVAVENGDENSHAVKSKKKKKDKKTKNDLINGVAKVDEKNSESQKLEEVSDNVEEPHSTRQESISNGHDVDQNENQDFTAVKSKKKKKKKSEKIDDTLINDTVVSNENSHLPVNDKKEEIKKTSNDCSIQNGDEPFTVLKDKRSKKYKNKENISTDVPSEGNADENSEPMNVDTADSVTVGEENCDNQKKKKKKRKLDQTEAECDDSSKRSRIEADECEISLKKFSWNHVVRTLLEKSKDKEMSLKKMTKKVVGEYQSSYSNDKSFEEIEKKFHKKIKKLPFVIVSKDRVQLYIQ